MKESRHNSGTSLFSDGNDPCPFVSVIFLSCLHPDLRGSTENRLQAEQWNQIQALTTSVGERLEGTDGTDGQFLSLLPGVSKRTPT